MDSHNQPVPAHITDNHLLPVTIQAWSIYLKDQGRSKYTIKAFAADLTLLADYLPTDKTLGDIRTKDLENFITWLEKERGIPCSPKSLSRRITSVKSFFRWLNQNAVIMTDPAEKLLQQTVVSPLPTVLTMKEVELVLDAANRLRFTDRPDARPYALVSLLLLTAMKKSECVALNLNHFELNDDAEPFVFVRYTNPRYRYKERKIALTAEWVAAFKEYQQQYDIREEAFPWSPRRLEYILEDIGKAAALDKHLSFDM